MAEYLGLEQFLMAPLSEVQQVAPACVVFVAGGTRRKAVSMGFSAESDGYAVWTRQQMVACFELLFGYGVKTIVHTLIGPNNFREVGPYRDKLVRWLADGLAREDVMAEYGRLGWRVRLFTDETIPALGEAAARLRQTEGEKTLWLHVTPAHDWFWERWLGAIQESQAMSRETAVHALYNEDVPAANMLLGHGKPEVFTDVLPLLGNAQCYWRQNLGYDLDERLWRTILYDYAFMRATWREDKQGRAEEALKYKDLLDRPTAIGLGTRLGPFWYPVPTPDPLGDWH